VPGLIAIHQNPSRQLSARLSPGQKASGCTRAGVLEDHFREETETDLLASRRCSAAARPHSFALALKRLSALAIRPSWLISNACTNSSSSSILFTKQEFAGMRRLISDTAKWGELTVGPKILSNGQNR